MNIARLALCISRVTNSTYRAETNRIFISAGTRDLVNLGAFKSKQTFSTIDSAIPIIEDALNIRRGYIKGALNEHSKNVTH